MSLDALTVWKPTPQPPLFAAHGLGTYFTKLGVGADAADLFGAPPKTFVHTGDVTLGSDVALEPDDTGVYVLDGSLTIDGTLSFTGHDAYTLLVVTGDLTAKNLVQEEDTMLVVLGQTRIEGLLYVSPSDAGFVHFAGAVTAGDLVSTGSDVSSELPRFAKKPKARLRSHDDWAKAVADRAGSNGPDVAFLRKALARGEALFAAKSPSPKGTPKPPSKAALAKMSVAELLLVRGFASAQVDTVVNPNYLTKGTAGASFESLFLMNDTVVDAFPPALASLRSLKLLGYRNAAPLARMLASLGVLAGLVELTIADTALAALPDVIGDLANLEHLEVRGNGALTTLPAAVGKLRSLRSLHLTDNAITTLPSTLAELVHLEKVVVNEEALVWPAGLAKLQAAARPR